MELHSTTGISADLHDVVLRRLGDDDAAVVRAMTGADATPLLLECCPSTEALLGHVWRAFRRWSDALWTAPHQACPVITSLLDTLCAGASFETTMFKILSLTNVATISSTNLVDSTTSDNSLISNNFILETLNSRKIPPSCTVGAASSSAATKQQAGSAISLAYLEHLPSRYGAKQIRGVDIKQQSAVVALWKSSVVGAKNLAAADDMGDTIKLFTSLAIKDAKVNSNSSSVNMKTNIHISYHVPWLQSTRPGLCLYPFAPPSPFCLNLFS